MEQKEAENDNRHKLCRSCRQKLIELNRICQFSELKVLEYASGQATTTSVVDETSVKKYCNKIAKCLPIQPMLEKIHFIE